MQDVKRDTEVVVRKGSHIRRGAGTKPEKLEALQTGTVTHAPLTVFLGRAAVAGGTAENMSLAHRRVVRPGKVRLNEGEVEVLPTAELLVPK